ncbi:Nop52-domain-containing protein [Xylariomycetidae sp. FL0641]|nr:Nop52-domain-containing protein [Xylariomycetidae sp. FL0641]
MAAADGANMPFIKHLASSDRKTRTSALQTLRTFLAASTSTRQLSALDHQKLWKGLFYSLWMADRPIPQQNLCAELADLISALSPSSPDAEVVAGAWLTAFWSVMAREWTGIDVLRLEKFLLLVRRVFGAALDWARSSEKRTDAFLRSLAAYPLEPAGDLAKCPVGLRLHVLDLWVDEAARLGLLQAAPADTTEAERDLLARLRALVEDQAQSTCKPVRLRARESLADERLSGYGTGDEGSEGEDEDEDEEEQETEVRVEVKPAKVKKAVGPSQKKKKKKNASGPGQRGWAGFDD